MRLLICQQKQSNLGKTVTDDKLSDRPAERTSLQERLAAMKARVSGTPAGRDAVDKAKGKDQIFIKKVFIPNFIPNLSALFGLGIKAGLLKML